MAASQCFDDCDELFDEDLQEKILQCVQEKFGVKITDTSTVLIFHPTHTATNYKVQIGSDMYIFDLQ